MQSNLYLAMRAERCREAWSRGIGADGVPTGSRLLSVKSILEEEKRDPVVYDTCEGKNGLTDCTRKGTAHASLSCVCGRGG